MLRRLKARGDRSVSEDNVGGTKLAVRVEEDLGLQYSVKILVIHQIEIERGKLFICSKVKKRGKSKVSK